MATLQHSQLWVWYSAETKLDSCSTASVRIYLLLSPLPRLQTNIALCEARCGNCELDLALMISAAGGSVLLFHCPLEFPHFDIDTSENHY